MLLEKIPTSVSNVWVSLDRSKEKTNNFVWTHKKNETKKYNWQDPHLPGKQEDRSAVGWRTATESKKCGKRRVENRHNNNIYYLLLLYSDYKTNRKININRKNVRLRERKNVRAEIATMKKHSFQNKTARNLKAKEKWNEERAGEWKKKRVGGRERKNEGFKIGKEGWYDRPRTSEQNDDTHCVYPLPRQTPPILLCNLLTGMEWAIYFFETPFLMTKITAISEYNLN